MSFDGSGVYSLTYTWAAEAASPPIAISKLDTEMAGIATGLSLCVLRNGNGVPLADMPWNDKKITGLADATAATDAMNRQSGDARWAQLGGAAFTGAVSGTSASFSSTLAAAGNFAINTDKFTVTAASGNTAIAGTLAVTGATTVGGSAVWHAGNDGSGSGLDADTLDGNQATAFVLASTVTSGTFTAALRASNGGADLATGTAYWHKHGRAVTVYLPELLTTNTTTTLVIDDIPAAIRFAVNGSAASYQVMMGSDNGALLPVAVACLYGTDYWTLKVASGYAAFNAAAANKGILSGSISYMMDDA
jgi:hypothetical protein